MPLPNLSVLGTYTTHRHRKPYHHRLSRVVATDATHVCSNSRTPPGGIVEQPLAGPRHWGRWRGGAWEWRSKWCVMVQWTAANRFFPFCTPFVLQEQHKPIHKLQKHASRTSFLFSKDLHQEKRSYSPSSKAPCKIMHPTPCTD